MLCCVVHVVHGAYRVTFVAEVLPVGLDEVANGSNTNHQPRNNTHKITMEESILRGVEVRFWGLAQVSDPRVKRWAREIQPKGLRSELRQVGYGGARTGPGGIPERVPAS